MNPSSANNGKQVILVADYGRSGQGWLSYMLCYILNAQYIEPYDFLKGLLYAKPHILTLTQGNLPDRESSPYSMVIKTHEYPVLKPTLTDKIIFLTRDPRDIAVSAYYRYKVMLKEEPPRTFKQWLFYFVHGIRPLSYALTAYKWSKFTRLWSSRTDLPLHKVTYENLSTKTEDTLKSILGYLGVPVNEEILKDAVDKFGFEKLAGRKKGEESTGNMAFRKGIIGDHKNKFSSFELGLFNWVAKAELEKNGYAT